VSKEQLYENKAACGIAQVYGNQLRVRFRRRVSVNEQRPAAMAASWKSPPARAAKAFAVVGNIARAAFRLGAIQAGRFKIIREVLDV